MSILDNYSIDEIKHIISSSNSISQVLKKLGYKQGGANYKTLIKYCQSNHIDINGLLSNSDKSRNRYSDEEIFSKSSPVSKSTLKNRFGSLTKDNYKCALCGIGPSWNAKKLILRLDHINGDNTDNRIENLRWVCPNCDSQLPTYCRRKRIQLHYCKRCHKKILPGNTYCNECSALISNTPLFYSSIAPSKDELIGLLSEYRNLEEIGRHFNVTGKTVQKWCKAFGLWDDNMTFKDYLLSLDQSSGIERNIVSLYQNNESFTGISKLVNRNVQFIKDVLIRNGIISHDSYFGNKPFKIAQLDSEGNIISVYDSIREANMALSGKGDNGHISAVLSGKRKSAFGFKWKKL